MNNVLQFPNCKAESAEASTPAVEKAEHAETMVLQHVKDQWGNRSEDGTVHFGVDTPKEVIEEAMLKKIAFSMDVALRPHGEEAAKADNARMAKKLEAKNRW